MITMYENVCYIYSIPVPLKKVRRNCKQTRSHGHHISPELTINGLLILKVCCIHLHFGIPKLFLYAVHILNV